LEEQGKVVVLEAEEGGDSDAAGVKFLSS